MSLDWNIQDVENYNELLEKNNISENTKELIFSTMSVGLNKITKDNINEWLFRRRVLNLIDPHRNPVIPAGWSQVEITREVLVRHIGLRTNASQMTRAAFMKRATQQLTQDAEAFAKR